jgi:hypothetical protein
MYRMLDDRLDPVASAERETARGAPELDLILDLAIEMV